MVIEFSLKGIIKKKLASLGHPSVFFEGLGGWKKPSLVQDIQNLESVPVSSSSSATSEELMTLWKRSFLFFICKDFT